MRYIIDNIDNYGEIDIQNFLNRIHKIKRDRIDKYKSNKRKRQAIVSEILLTKLLKEINIDYDNIEIFYNKNGKPYIKNSQIYFNISHSQNYVACAISKREIGIDIEVINNINEKILNKINCSNIVINDLSVTEKSIRILMTYVLKEAYLKMKGWSFNKLEEIKITQRGNDIILDEETIINCKTLIKPNKYIIAICEQK